MPKDPLAASLTRKITVINEREEVQSKSEMKRIISEEHLTTDKPVDAPLQAEVT